MIRGIGIDSVTISELKAMTEKMSEGAVSRMFTPEELRCARSASYPAEYLAARFAAKEAVFKAVAHLLPEKHFDLRKVETLNRSDGSPYVNTDGPLGEVLKAAGVSTVHVSITTEKDTGTAFVIAE